MILLSGVNCFSREKKNQFWKKLPKNARSNDADLLKEEEQQQHFPERKKTSKMYSSVASNVAFFCKITTFSSDVLCKNSRRNETEDAKPFFHSLSLCIKTKHYRLEKNQFLTDTLYLSRMEKNERERVREREREGVRVRERE